MNPTAIMHEITFITM